MTGATTVTVRRPDGSTQTLSYSDADFAGDKLGCDLVMKGGITSGVVYPLTVAELAKSYRFHGIGGTSVGAVAAAVTAAAEYARDRGGFQKLVKIPDDLAGGLVQKFQPEPKLAVLFDIMLAALKKPSGGTAGVLFRILWRAMLGYWPWTLIALALGVVLAALAWPATGFWAIAIGIGTFVIALAILLGWRLFHSLTVDLPAADFGLCSGKTVRASGPKAFTDWLADLLDEVAARPPELSDHPLTFEDLESGSNPVQLRMMTSDISMGRPYELPLRDNLHFFSKAEFQRLFPDRVVAYMTSPAVSKLLPPESQNAAGDLHYLPEGRKLPVVVAARMSLSFPGLIQAVPLHKRDFLLKTQADRKRPVRCLFSDGGLTSNFPIHFFDRLWPNRPTFAINLDKFNPRADDDDHRTWMQIAAGAGQVLPINEVRGLGGFFWALFNTAKGWQDTLQAMLPGYRERIVHIALKNDEGGLNLEMPKETIELLTGFGEEAGRAVLADFDMGQHRWRRHLTAIARVEETFARMHDSHTQVDGGVDTFGTFLATYNPQNGSYKLTGAPLNELKDKTAEIVALAAAWQGRIKIRERDEIPDPASVMRITTKP